MPVLLKEAEASVYSPVDVETLVSEVRERLCLKQREKLCSSRRSAPYCVNKRHSSLFEHSSGPHRKHFSSPESCQYQDNLKHRQRSSCTACPCGKKMSSKFRDSGSFEDPHALLEKLLAEQSLIQEAVRRLQSRTQTTTAESASACAAKKIFPFAYDDDSCDQFSNQTPSYAESEEDSVSQHSVDL